MEDSRRYSQAEHTSPPGPCFPQHPSSELTPSECHLQGSLRAAAGAPAFKERVAADTAMVVCCQKEYKEQECGRKKLAE